MSSATLPASRFESALRDFHRARRQAVFQQLLARVRGDAAELMRFDEVRRHLRDTGQTIQHGLQEIPLDRIVGSVDRYEDFTRSFLPTRDSDAERWAGVRVALKDRADVPPIHVYQLGDAYFVQDGNHRVSIARQLDHECIAAYVTEVVTRVPMTAEDDPNEIICKSYYAAFLERTNLDVLRPGADLTMTFCGKYAILLEQIEEEARSLARHHGETAPEAQWDHAVGEWYDHVYQPVVRLIHEVGALHRFPERTATDLYALLSERQTELEAELGWQVERASAVSALRPPAPRPRTLLERVLETVAPTPEGEPPPGLWRQQQLARQRYHHLFKHILVALEEAEASWHVLDYILEAAQLDQDHLLGLHVVPEPAMVASERVRQMRERFEAGCRAAGLQGEFAVEVHRQPVRALLQRAAWVDCVIVRGTRPPDGRPLARLSPELKLLIEQCPRPIQIRPDGTTSDNSRALLAYDGSPKADEALFVATYLTARWNKALTVVTVETEDSGRAALERARQYLTRHGLNQVEYVLQQGPVAEAVLETARAQRSNLLFIGGFSFRTIGQVALGSAAERILREFPDPVWVCR